MKSMESKTNDLITPTEQYKKKNISITHCNLLECTRKITDFTPLLIDYMFHGVFYWTVLPTYLAPR